MTRNGLKAALQHANSLPSFRSTEEAEQHLFQLRDELKNELQKLARESDVKLDFRPESLKTLERWYFDLLEADGFDDLELTQEEFERCMGFYNGFVFTENGSKFTWFVEESDFAAGKFEIGVTDGWFTRVVGRIAPTLKNNKRMQSMFREYQQYA